MPSPKRIGRIEFGLLSPSEIRDMSARKIIWADTYDDDGFPYPQGLMDLNLGVIDPGLRCKTCDQKASECPGHFGHIELAKPVIHIGYTRLIRKLLRVTCRSCGSLLLSSEEIERIIGTEDDQTGDYLDESDVKKERICPYCDEQQLKINLEKPTTFSEVVIESGRKIEHNLTPADIRARMEKISDDVLILLGINPDVARPEWTILTVLPVPPVTMRPSIILEDGQRSEDDLTHKLVDIIRINQRFKENQDAGAPQMVIEDLGELLQYHVTTYMDNETGSCPPARHRSGRPLKTLSQRLKGKEGRFRDSLSGKRVNFSSRTVISPDPNLSVRQVGVPRAIANEMTVPVRVTIHNFEELKRVARTGPLRPDINSPGGANYVIRPDNRRLRLAEGNLDLVADMIEPGWTVERHLRDGDIVLFNRQPSLHRMSIMAHQVKVLEGKTFRLNPAVCPPYNANFDGGEMNMHVPQTEEARAEASILISVQENITSPRFGGPIIGGIHDHISGIFMLTHGTRWFTKEEALYLLRYSRIEHMPAPGKEENGIPYWSNKQIFSTILPEHLTMFFQTRSCLNCASCKMELCKRNAFVRIIDGILESGTIDKKAIGAFDGQIVNSIIRQYSKSRATDFIDDLTQLSIRAIMFDGLSFGIDDADLSRTDYDQIDTVLVNAALDVERRIKFHNERRLEPMPGRTIEETLEMKIIQVLGKARDMTGQIVGRHHNLDNSAVLMAISGARGSMLNLTQMAGCVGQQCVRGERITRGYENRTLPHFSKDDQSLAAKGFIKHSYKEGLTPTEFFFHAISGREGLVDIAVRISQSGYLQRRMINALQDLKVAYDGTVRTTSGRIIQFEYGEDGTDPAKSAYGEAVDVKGIIDSVLSDSSQAIVISEVGSSKLPSIHIVRHKILESEYVHPVVVCSEVILPTVNDPIIIQSKTAYPDVITAISNQSEIIGTESVQTAYVQPEPILPTVNKPVITEIKTAYQKMNRAPSIRPKIIEFEYVQPASRQPESIQPPINKHVMNYSESVNHKVIKVPLTRPKIIECDESKKCQSCGIKNPSTHIFCSYCGTKIIEIKNEHDHQIIENIPIQDHLELVKEKTRNQGLIFLNKRIGKSHSISPEFFEDTPIGLPEKSTDIFPSDPSITDDIDSISQGIAQEQLSDIVTESPAEPVTGGQFANHISENERDSKECSRIPENEQNKEIEKLFAAGKQFEMDKNFEGAIDCYSAILQLNNNDAFTWDRKGQCYDMSGSFDDALPCYETALTLDPSCSSAWYHKGEWFALNGEFDQSLLCFDKVIAIDSTFGKVWYSKGYVFERLEEHQKAIECFDKYLEFDQNDVTAWINKAYNYEKLHENEQSLDCYDVALGLNPHDKSIWSLKGSLFKKMGNKYDANLCFERAIQFDPGCTDILNVNDELTLQTPEGNTTVIDEEPLFLQENQILPDNFHECISCGISLMDSKKFEDALQYFNKAQKLDPGNSDSWVFQFVCNKKLNPNLEIKDCYSSDFEEFSRHALNFYKKNDWERSLKYYEATIELHPKDPYLWEMTGACHEQLGNMEKAQFYYENSKELGSLQ